MSEEPAKHAVIYIPGLGDQRILGQKLAVSAWRFQGVEPHLFHVRWADREAYELKFQRLLKLIDQLAGKGMTVSLVGASAGGSMMINAYAARQHVIHGAVGICGKLLGRGIGSVHGSLYGRNPAFLTSMEKLPESDTLFSQESRQRVLSLHPIADESVPIAETRLPDSTERTMPVAGHFMGIAYGLTLGSFGVINFLKNLPGRGAV